MLATLGCGRAPHPSVVASASPSAVQSLKTPAATCPTAETGEVLDDRVNGFRLVMPKEWRNLRPGDAGWLTLYGEYGTETERRVMKGELKDFAVPLEPRDVDTLATLAVYIDPKARPDLERDGSSYAAQLRDYFSATHLNTRRVTLPAGEAVIVEGQYPFGEGYDITMQLVSAMVYQGNARYSLVLVHQQVYAARFRPVFECMATSLVFTGPGPTPTWVRPG